ncbi:AMP-dependent synthetase/ligase [Knoellia subterranea]|uniref:Acyl-CoA synthetase n=1 Tax=Knoellia subterranea KCTC 19937 TaxID=1385521 RepID=A0A0A0JJD0_9MICO|nr:long-chain fatty acid--CoA ligase [Knoellia subterranea]KGN36157.1 AMP-dependent synthetase [Knoellia subterranea KCTC 19937]
MTSVAPQIQTPGDEPVDFRLIEERAASVGHLFRERVAATPDAVAFQYAKVGAAADGSDEWVTATWSEVRDAVHEIGAGLVALGVGPEERVALASSTRYEWALADLGVMVAGAVTTTIYPTTIDDDVAFILGDSQSKVVFAEDADQVAKLRRIANSVPGVGKVVTFDPEAATGEDDWVISLDALMALGRSALERTPGLIDERIDALTPDRLATIIYTSGTTGRPKGVRLLHKSWTYEAAAVDAISVLREDDLQYLWLPLAHVFGKLLLTLPLQIGFPTAIDGRIDKIVDNLAVVKPTFMGAAPRIFEKAYNRVNMMMEEEGGVKLKLFRWATGVGREVSLLREQGKAPSGLLGFQHSLADKLVLSKVRERFGGRVRLFISGSAALNQDVARWFDSVGMLVGEGYGLTESSAATTVNRTSAYSYGTVGWPLPGTEIKVAEDGELLLRGDGIMDGYHNNPEATAEVLDADGWFHTGDIGEVNERGFFKITDRKKDLFKTSGGKYVAPSIIESTFKGLCPYVSQFVVHGADRNFVSALVTLDPEAIQGWADANGMGGKSYAEIVSSDEAHAMVQGYVDELNSGLNRWETIKKFTILDHDLTVDSGELTPSLKLKRKVVSERYKDMLDAHYAGA